MISFSDFYGTIFYVQDYIVIPLAKIKLENKEYLKNNKWNHEKIKRKILDIYEEIYSSKRL